MNVITYTLCVLFRGPISPGDYAVRSAMVKVSYPSDSPVPFMAELFSYPHEWSTRFDVTWNDPDGKDVERIRRGAELIGMVTHKAFDYVNELLLNFKMVTLGTTYGHGIRTLGDGDLVCDMYQIDQNGVVPFRLMTLKIHRENGDPIVSELARKHLSTETFPIGRRFVRCVELYEHGFYSEAFIVAFSILDDVVQKVLHVQLHKSGMTEEKDRKELVRGIKENRLKLFLGSIMKLVSGIDLEEKWRQYSPALEWMNSIRNGIAHNGKLVDRSTAAKGIFVAVKLVHILHQANLVDVGLQNSLLRLVWINAKWTENPPDWCPTDDELRDFPGGSELFQDLSSEPR